MSTHLPMPSDAEAAVVAHELRTPGAHFAAVEAMCIAYRAALETGGTFYALQERIHRIADALAPHVAPFSRPGPPDTAIDGQRERMAAHGTCEEQPEARSPCQQVEDAGLSPTPAELAREGR